MKVKEVMYRKEDGGTKKYKVLILKEDLSSIEGISMADLSEEEQKKIISIYKEFEEKLDPYYKTNYRKLLKSKITGVLGE